MVVDITQYKNARSLINTYAQNIGVLTLEEREAAWKKLRSDVQALGFENPEAVLTYGAATRNIFNNHPRFKVTRDYGDTLIQTEIAGGPGPGRIFVVLPNKPCIVLQKNYPLDMLIDSTRMTILRTAEDDPVLTRVVCLDKGVVNVVGHLKLADIKGLNYEILQTLAKGVIDRLGIPNITRVHNDLFTDGNKIAGVKIKRDSFGLVLIAFFISFDFDRTVFKNAFKDETIYDNLPLVKLGIPEGKVLQAIKDEWELTFGFETGV